MSLPILPEGTKPLSHQVAGHIFGKGKHKYGFLESNDGDLLKPVQSPPRGPRELTFYQKVFDAECDDPVLLELRTLLPRYLGTWTTAAHPGVQYFRLEDITKQFKNPNILDVKVGPITYDPDATPEKIAQEKSKYPPLPLVRFQLIGMRIYDAESGQNHKIDRKILRSLDENEILWQGLARYVNYTKDSQRHIPVVESLLKRLREIKHWFETQKELCFFASSLLLVHEGSMQCSESENRPSFSTNCQDTSTSNATYYEKIQVNGARPGTADDVDNVSDIRMIDFAHVFPTDTTDENYLSGLNSLIKYFERLL